MPTKTREELETEMKQDRQRTEDAVRTLMRLDPAHRITVLLSRWFDSGARDAESMKVSEKYEAAWFSVSAGAVEGTQESLIRGAVEHDIHLRRKQLEERELVARLDERVEALEGMLGQVLSRLIDLEDKVGPHLNTVPPPGR